MKHGFNPSWSDGEVCFQYWVMPDRPMNQDFPGVSSWDGGEMKTQREQIINFLNNAVEPGNWREHNFRYLFVKEEDYEMFKLMCLVGWS